MEEEAKTNSRRLKTNSMLNVSNTIGACNYMTRNRQKVSETPTPANISKQNKMKSFVRNKNFQHESPTPVIIISNNHQTDTTEKVPVSETELKQNVIAALKSEKSKHEKSERKNRRRSCGDMDHIRAKWLLGFNLTMVCWRLSLLRADW